MSTKVKVCFNGCSFTAGEGFDSSQRKLHVYDCVLADQHNWDSDNIAVKGSSNHTIFLRSAQAIQSQQYNIVFTQWSALNRIWLSPGPETYYFVNDLRRPDYSYRDLYINQQDKKKLNQLLLLLNHDYQNILDLVGYCRILEQLAELNKTRIIFINGLVPWQSDLVQPLSQDLNNTLSEYTKEILDFKNRNDIEIINYFSKLQQQISTLDSSNWVNMFDSFQSNVCDIAPAGHHPGVKSHQWMAKQINTYLGKL
jgi:hypothetical protein